MYKWLSFTAYYNYVLDMYMTWYKPYRRGEPSECAFADDGLGALHSYYCGANIRVAPWFWNLVSQPHGECLLLS